MKPSKQIPLWLTIDVLIIVVGLVIIAGGIWITNARIFGVPVYRAPVLTQRGPWIRFDGWPLYTSLMTQNASVAVSESSMRYRLRALAAFTSR